MTHTLRYLGIILLAITVILIVAYFGIYYITMKNVNEPSYKLITREKSIEVRQC